MDSMTNLAFDGISLDDLKELQECCPIESLPTAGLINDTDYMMISQGGVISKVSIETLKTIFLGETNYCDSIYDVTFNGDVVMNDCDKVIHTPNFVLYNSDIVIHNGQEVIF